MNKFQNNAAYWLDCHAAKWRYRHDPSLADSLSLIFCGTSCTYLPYISKID